MIGPGQYLAMTPRLRWCHGNASDGGAAHY